MTKKLPYKYKKKRRRKKLELDKNGKCYVFDGPEEILALPAVGHGVSRDRQFQATFAAVSLDGPWAQFGVYNGLTARMYLLPCLPQKSVLYLFDSFEGLPEAWDKGMSVTERGRYATQPPYFRDQRAIIVKGLFKDTLLDLEGDPFALIDIDCDIYSSTREVLYGINDRIVAGTVIRFDEVFSYPNWRDHEYRAIQEWLRDCDRRIEWISRGPIYWATCRVTK